MRFRLLFTLAMLLAATAGAAPTLQAIAEAEYTEVHPQTVFEVTLTLRNITALPEKIKVPDCSWDRDWKSSDHRVTWDPWDCDEDSVETVEIPPHKTYVFPATLKMYVDASPDKESNITFRMGFRTTAFGERVWSNPITLDVIP
jgi:hypothetical protein